MNTSSMKISSTPRLAGAVAALKQRFSAHDQTLEQGRETGSKKAEVSDIVLSTSSTEESSLKPSLGNYRRSSRGEVTASDGTILNPEGAKCGEYSIAESQLAGEPDSRLLNLNYDDAGSGVELDYSVFQGNSVYGHHDPQVTSETYRVYLDDSSEAQSEVRTMAERSVEELTSTFQDLSSKAGSIEAFKADGDFYENPIETEEFGLLTGRGFISEDSTKLVLFNDDHHFSMNKGPNSFAELTHTTGDFTRSAVFLSDSRVMYKESKNFDDPFETALS